MVLINKYICQLTCWCHWLLSSAGLLSETHFFFFFGVFKLDVLPMAASGKLISNLNWTGNCDCLLEHDQELAVGTNRW